MVAESDFASHAIFGTEFSLKEKLSHQDNMSTIENGIRKSDKMRHMNVRFFWTKERFDNGEIQIVYTPTNDMIVDILIKPLQGDKFLTRRRFCCSTGTLKV